MTKPISASQLKKFDSCPRSWAFAYIEGIREESGDAATLGVTVHAEMEAWVRDGKLPQHPLALKLLGLFKDHPYYPAKGTTEAESEFTMTIDGVKWRGFMDGRRPREAGEVIVIDYKTTSDIHKWALRAEGGLLVDAEGKPDIQSTLYAAKEFVAGAESVYGIWAYVGTKSPHPAKLVEVKFDRERVETIYGGMHERAKVIQTLVQLRPKSNDIPYRTQGCFAFNRPCFYADRCQKPVGMFSSKPLDLGAPEGADAMVDFLSKIRDSFPTTTIDTVIDEDDAPPPPPPEEDDAPEAPPEEASFVNASPTDALRPDDRHGMVEADDEPPPPPDEDEVHPAEALAAEAAVSPEVSRCVTDAVESGFVNPPEAAGKPAYKDPAEAAEGEGVAPPKAKKLSKAKGKTAKKAETKKSVAELLAEGEASPVAEGFSLDRVVKRVAEAAVVSAAPVAQDVQLPAAVQRALEDIRASAAEREAAEGTRPRYKSLTTEECAAILDEQGIVTAEPWCEGPKDPATGTPFLFTPGPTPILYDPEAGRRERIEDTRTIIREELRAMFGEIARMFGGGK